jgi:hypothetical protein
MIGLVVVREMRGKFVRELTHIKKESLNKIK